MDNVPEDHGKKYKPFGKFRNLFWPIYTHELNKLLPMFALFFLISFVYNLLRCMKIAIIVKAEGSGAEIIPILKVGAVLPGAIILTYIFTVLVSKYERERVFYTILLGFISYFALFTFYLYPNHELLRLDWLADFLQTIFSAPGFKGMIASIRHLNLTIFYVLAEMWSSVVLSMLFWGFANEVTKIHEAKRFYAIFALGANCSGIASSSFALWVKNHSSFAFSLYPQSEQWVFMQLSFVLIIGMIIIFLFRWLNRSVFHFENVQSLQLPKKKNNLSMKECFIYLKNSKYLACIVTIVVGYNVVYNLADVMWTHRVEQTFTTSGEVNSYINQITSVTGIIAVIFAFVISGNTIRYYGWLITALITPIIWGLTSIGFFGGLVLDNFFLESGGFILGSIVANPANMILLLGSIQICFGRACKYTVFDETKEIAFIPLSKDEQRKGKAIVDGLASRFGKSGGAIIYIVLFMLCGGIANTIPYISVIIFVAIACWLYAVMRLGKMVDTTEDITDFQQRVNGDESSDICSVTAIKDHAPVDTKG